MATDAQLIERLTTDESGDALRALYRAYSGELFGFAVNALGERGAAEELVQEVFTRAWRHAERYDPARASVRTWLYQIARHAIIDLRRRASVRPGLALHEPTAGQEPTGESIEQAMLGWQVATALERLSPDHRQMIRLAHLQGLTMREIAAAHRPPGGDRQEPHLVRAARAAAGARGDGDPMSALRTCDDLRPLLGGYVLEALEPDEMAAVREHLPNCPACSAEHASLAGLPALLDLAAPLDAPDEPLSPAFEEALLDRFARDREAAREPESERAPRRRRRLPRIAWTRPRVAVASGLLAAALTFATMTALDDDPPSQPAASRNYVVQLKARRVRARRSRVSGRVALYRVRGGTGVHLWASGLRSGRKHVYEVLCEKGGWSASAGTFRADANGRVEAKLTTAARVGEYDSLRVVYRDERGHPKDVLTGRLF